MLKPLGMLARTAACAGLVLAMTQQPAAAEADCAIVWTQINAGITLVVTGINTNSPQLIATGQAVIADATAMGEQLGCWEPEQPGT